VLQTIQAIRLLRETPSLAHQVPVGPLAPLHYAVREGHAGIVQLLLQHGADAHVVVGGTLWGIPL
jgi:ankyrin repeat protein